MYYCTNCVDYNYNIYKISFNRRLHLQKLNLCSEINNDYVYRYLQLDPLYFTICGSCHAAGDDVGIDNHYEDYKIENGKSIRHKYICKNCSSCELIDITIQNHKLHVNIPNNNMTSLLVKDILKQSKLMSPNLDYFEIYYCIKCSKISDDKIRFDDSRYVSPRTREHEYKMYIDEINSTVYSQKQQTQSQLNLESTQVDDDFDG